MPRIKYLSKWFHSCSIVSFLNIIKKRSWNISHASCRFTVVTLLTNIQNPRSSRKWMPKSAYLHCLKLREFSIREVEWLLPLPSAWPRTARLKSFIGRLQLCWANPIGWCHRRVCLWTKVSSRRIPWLPADSLQSRLAKSECQQFLC